MKKCSTCKYGKRYGGKKENYFCDYLLMTGHRRECPWEDCIKYERINGKRKEGVFNDSKCEKK